MDLLELHRENNNKARELARKQSHLFDSTLYLQQQYLVTTTNEIFNSTNNSEIESTIQQLKLSIENISNECKLIHQKLNTILNEYNKKIMYEEPKPIFDRSDFLLKQIKQYKIEIDMLNNVDFSDSILSKEDHMSYISMIIKEIKLYCEQLDETLSYYKSEQQETKKLIEIESQKKLEYNQIYDKLDNILGENLSMSDNDDGIHDDKVLELTEKKSFLSNLKDEYQKNLEKFLSTYYDDQDNNEKRKKKRKKLNKEQYEFKIFDSSQYRSLVDLLSSLLDNSLPNSDYEYVQLNLIEKQVFLEEDEDLLDWPPYIELLIRSGIAEKHPEHSDQLRLVHFG
eukprot:TRINITY_DN12914_c0_g1_i1.p1 TRINITY_DN12914_c0_g1~~TRINITY_DN12914_c0_g1_i1.p1  ORF type:complete len:340 (+),score=65.06 TRINITY_DN12914_c0_g1_i1:153-1172(+)